MSFVYFLGSKDGEYVKVGYAADERKLRNRSRAADGAYQTEFVFLAAVVGVRTQEQRIIDLWTKAGYLAPFIDRREGFYAKDEVRGYVAWLRRQWFATTDLDEIETEGTDFDHWGPSRERVWTPDPEASDSPRLFSVDRLWNGPVASTEWAWTLPVAPAEDWYTNLELFRALDSVIGFDLDVASHPIPNRTLRFADYYEIRRSGLTHRWFGKVWCHPPGGDRSEWFSKALEAVEDPAVEAIAVYVPAHAIRGSVGKELLRSFDVTFAFGVAPKFWGPTTGSAYPQSLLYAGSDIEKVVDIVEALPFDAVALRPWKGSL